MDESFKKFILRLFDKSSIQLLKEIIFMSILQFIAIFGAVSSIMFGLFIFIGSVFYILKEILKLKKPISDIAEFNLPSYDSLYNQKKLVPETDLKFSTV
jgi:hypothetical protein